MKFILLIGLAAICITTSTYANTYHLRYKIKNMGHSTLKFFKDDKNCQDSDPNPAEFTLQPNQSETLTMYPKGAGGCAFQTSWLRYVATEGNKTVGIAVAEALQKHIDTVTYWEPKLWTNAENDIEIKEMTS